MLGDNSYTKISRGHPFQIKELFEFKALNENNIYVVKMKQLLALSQKIDKVVCYVPSYNFLKNFNF